MPSIRLNKIFNVYEIKKFCNTIPNFIYDSDVHVGYNLIDVLKKDRNVSIVQFLKENLHCDIPMINSFIVGDKEFIYGVQKESNNHYYLPTQLRDEYKNIRTFDNEWFKLALDYDLMFD